MINGTDYTINGKTVTLTASGMVKMASYLENGGNSSGGDDTPMTYTLVGEEDSAAKYVLANLPKTDNPSKYAKDDTVTFSIKTKTGETPTATELYLVKVTIKKRYTGDVLDIPITYNKENHTVSFTMPDNDVMVRADFYDVVFKGKGENDNESYPFTVATDENTDDRDFDVGLCFNEEVFDNLESIDDKYVFRVANKSKITKEKWSYDYGNYSNYGWYYRFNITTDTETGISFVHCAIVDGKFYEPTNDPEQIDL